MNKASVTRYIKSLEGAKLSHPYGKDLAVYSIEDQMFAIVEVKKPLRVSLRCDRKLATILKERYEEVMPGHKLNQNKWITVVLSGQLSLSEIQGLIDHSYQLARAEDSPRN
jgi:predicted DNA-binding protein (MmcQ/YjbR family)